MPAPPPSILDHAPVLMAYVDADERYRYVNARYADTFGRELSDITGKHLREVLGAAAYGAVRDQIERVLAGRGTQYRRWMTLPDGHARFFHTSYRPHVEGGSVRGFFVYGLDVTAEKRIEETLQESERRFRAVFETAAVGIAMVALDRRFLAVNRHACEMLGYSEEELLSMVGHVVSHPDDEAATADALRRLLDGEASHVEIEKRFRRKGGGVIWTTTSVSVVRDLSGEPKSLIVVIDDVTERKRAQEALAASERSYRGVFDNAAVGMARIAPDGQWLDINDHLCRKLGYSRGELQELSFQDVTHPDDLGADLRQAERLARGEIDHYEMDKRYIRGDGSVMWGRLTASSVRDDDGNVLYLVGVVENITARKEAEKALREAALTLERRVEERTAELTTLNQELDAFNYSVSHDLRAPLRGIDGFSQALLEEYGDRLDERGRGYLDRVRAGARRMGELIDALLAISRLARGELRRGEVDLGAVAREVAHALREEAPERRAAFTVHPGLVVHGDERLLRAVMGNLLENAWKFTRDVPEARIEVGATRAGDETVFWVRDNGAGFDPRYADKLFAPFQRLHGAAEFEGQGVGLAIAQRIVHRHGGRMWAEGAVGEGAMFSFTLPSSERR